MMFVTATGDISVLDEAALFTLMKDGAIICNSGHFNVEINLDALQAMADWRTQPCRSSHSSRSTALNGRSHLCSWAKARLINLAAAEGHPASVMDMSFANQALAAEYMLQNVENLCSAGLYYTR